MPQKRLVCISVILICTLLLNSNMGNSHSQPNNDFYNNTPHTILRIIDGDTVDIRYNSVRTRVRLIGIDTPESYENYAKETLTFTQNLLKGEAVYLQFDGNRRDTYGRLRAYLYRAPDGLFVNLEMVRQGYATADKHPRFKHKHSTLFQSYEKKARGAGKGIWIKPINPGDFTHRKRSQ